MVTLLNGLPLAAITNSGLPAALPAISAINLPGSGANARVTFASAHGLVPGQPIALTGSSGVSGLNATWPVNIVNATVVELAGSAALTGTPAGSPAAAIPALSIAASSLVNLTIRTTGDGVLQIEDSVNDFSASVIRWVRPMVGEQVLELQPADFATFHRFGTASAKLRVRCIAGAFDSVGVHHQPA